jgi:hypothetical protein
VILTGVDRTKVKGATAILDRKKVVASRPFFRDKAGCPAKAHLTQCAGGGVQPDPPLERRHTPLESGLDFRISDGVFFNVCEGQGQNARPAPKGGGSLKIVASPRAERESGPGFVPNRDRGDAKWHVIVIPNHRRSLSVR